VPGNIDSTKLKRAAFLGATSAYFLANFNGSDLQKLEPVLRAAFAQRLAKMIKAGSTNEFRIWYEEKLIESLNQYVDLPGTDRAKWKEWVNQLMPGSNTPSSANSIIYVRNPELRGPMGVFGYNYLEEHYGIDPMSALKLLKLEKGSIYAYEALNFVDGKRNLQEIVNLLSAAYGPVPRPRDPGSGRPRRRPGRPARSARSRRSRTRRRAVRPGATAGGG